MRVRVTVRVRVRVKVRVTVRVRVRVTVRVRFRVKVGPYATYSLNPGMSEVGMRPPTP